MKLNKKFLRLSYELFVTLAFCGAGVTVHSIQTVNANTNMYQTMRRQDLRYLHAIGNRKAKLANAQASYGDTGYDYTGTLPVYHHDKHGNYWSYFRDHQAAAVDGIATDPHYTSSYRRHDSGFMVNEEVLRNHGIDCGPNFQHASYGAMYQ